MDSCGWLLLCRMSALLLHLPSRLSQALRQDASPLWAKNAVYVVMIGL